MVDAAISTDSDGNANETANQKQARLRRERRQKKMEEQGDDRLARIKALNGGVAPPEEILGGPGAQGSKIATVEDPEEADIDSISQPTAGKDVNAKDNPLAAAMLQMQEQEARNQQQKSDQNSSEADPMVRMMEQMMGMMGGNPQDPNAKPPDVPPALKALLAAGGANQDQAPPPTESAYIWKVVHAVFAFLLAGYIALSSTFNGSKLARSESVYSEDEGHGFGRKLFLIFCTAELVLQSTRYFAEKGQLQGNGILAKVANSGFVPEPWAGHIRIIGRYVGIVQTIARDAMVIIFVFGALAWWQGLPIS